MYDINTHKDITNYKNVYHCQYNYSLQLIVPPTIDKTDNSQLRVMLTNGKGEFIDYYNYVIDSTVNSEGGHNFSLTVNRLMLNTSSLPNINNIIVLPNRKLTLLTNKNNNNLIIYNTNKLQTTVINIISNRTK